MNVTYAEIMLTHILFEEEDFEKECLLMEQYTPLKKEIAPRLKLNFLICIGRINNREKMELKVNRIIKLFERGLVQGFSLAADESACEDPVLMDHLEKE